jgi:heat shock protein HslJ
MSTGDSTPAAAGFNRIALPALAALVAACTSVNPTQATFEDTSWQVTAINGQPVPANDMYRVQFTAGRIGGRFGCNQFGGDYRIQDQRMIVGDVVSTLIGCPEPAATHERQGLAVLGQPMRMDWESGTRFTLSNASGSIRLDKGH